VTFVVAILSFLAIHARSQPVPPGITTQPADQAVGVGMTASFTILATGTNLSYQWRREGMDVAGATNANLTVTNVQFTNAGAYTVLVTNLADAVTSRVAQLSVAEGRIYTNALGARLGYRLFLPDNYNPAKKYPLVTFWHGSGEAGTDNLSQLKDFGQFIFLSATNRTQHPCFYVAPQFRSATLTCADNLAILDQGAELLNVLKAEFSIDPDRVYFTGLSFGGYVSWIFPARHANLVAAIVPMSGGWLCHTNFLNIRVPVWNFHAADDGTVGVGNSDSAVTALRNAGGNPIYTRYPSGGHVIWPKAYRTPTLVDWVMAQKRGAPSTTSPFVTISAPTADATYVTTLATVDVGGTASHYTNVLQVAWKNTANGVGGAATGTNLWSVKGIPLRVGATNAIVVTGTGTSYSPDLSSRGDTTFTETLKVIQIALQLEDLSASPDGQSISFTVHSIDHGHARYKLTEVLPRCSA